MSHYSDAYDESVRQNEKDRLDRLMKMKRKLVDQITVLESIPKLDHVPDRFKWALEDYKRWASEGLKEWEEDNIVELLKGKK